MELPRVHILILSGLVLYSDLIILLEQSQSLIIILPQFSFDVKVKKLPLSSRGPLVASFGDQKEKRRSQHSPDPTKYPDPKSLRWVMIDLGVYAEGRE